MNRTEREEEPFIEAALQAERDICNHPLPKIVLAQTVKTYPIIERPEASQLNRTINL